ncbi:MAG: hypothetical protein IPM98_14625 [Lewinellaceae bacterium]|nr:hypothetical protein [Lewinellaceae bacterium]
MVHAINDKSPLWGLSQQELQDSNAEFMVLVKGTDEANQQVVHARRSYTGEEIVFNARFKPMIGRNAQGIPQVMVRQMGAYEIVE